MTQTTKKAATPQTATKRRVKTPPKKVEAAAAPKVNRHLEAGIKVQRYTGPSSFVNGNRRVKVLTGVTRDKLTDRAASGLYALRDCYGNAAWEPKGFDNGILRDLLALGLIKPAGGQTQTIDGAPYLVDAAKPVTFIITEAGMGYGKAA